MIFAISTILLILLIFALIAVIGFFSSSETAYLSLTKIKVREMIRAKSKHAHLVAKLHDDIESLLTLVLVGTNFVNSLTTALATMLAVAIVGNSGVGIVTIVVTFFATTFGQIVPKTYAVTQPAKTANGSAPVLNFLRKILFPVIWLFTAISKFVATLADKIWKEENNAITTEELQALFDVGEHEGTLEKSETRMLNKVFEFNDLRVHDIMRHRSFIRGVSQTADYTAIIAAFATYGYSRLVVYEPESENVVGIIDYKSVLFHDTPDSKQISPLANASPANASPADVASASRCISASEGISASKSPLANATSLAKAPLFVPETFTPFELLEKMQEAHETFAVVLDEQGTTAGIATIDDVMRVVFDRMTDDNLVASVPPEERIKIINNNEFVLPGDMNINDVNELFNFNLESEDFNTLGGWLLEQFGSLPYSGEVLKYHSTLFIIEDQSQRRIKSVRVRKF